VQFSGPLKEGRDGFGPLKQRFTYPLFPASGLFLELTQREHGEEKSRTFVRGTVEALYKEIERDQVAGVEQTIIDYQATPFSMNKEHPSLERAS
jgi:methylmalonyl-CoA/ethylmalonyl-CoA epimerase